MMMTFYMILKNAAISLMLADMLIVSVTGQRDMTILVIAAIYTVCLTVMDVTVMFLIATDDRCQRLERQAERERRIAEAVSTVSTGRTQRATTAEETFLRLTEPIKFEEVYNEKLLNNFRQFDSSVQLKEREEEEKKLFKEGSSR